MNTAKGPLSHVKVLDLSRILAAPWASQILADLGAEVNKVERPGAGDDTRTWGPPFLKDAEGKDTKEAGYYLAVNRGKRSITVSLEKPEGQKIVKELAARADIVLENYKAGTLKRYGLDEASLRQINPRLIYCSVTGFGQTGPRRDQPAYDFLIQAMGGLMSVTGEKDGRPGGGPQKVGRAEACGASAPAPAASPGSRASARWPAARPPGSWLRPKARCRTRAPACCRSATAWR